MCQNQCQSIAQSYTFQPRGALRKSKNITTVSRIHLLNACVKFHGISMMSRVSMIILKLAFQNINGSIEGWSYRATESTMRSGWTGLWHWRAAFPIYKHWFLIYRTRIVISNISSCQWSVSVKQLVFFEHWGSARTQNTSVQLWNGCHQAAVHVLGPLLIQRVLVLHNINILTGTLCFCRSELSWNTPM